MKNKKWNHVMVLIVIVTVIGFGVFAYLGMFREFDASAYVNAVLAQRMKGNVQLITEMTKDMTKEQANEEYERLITDTVEQVFCTSVAMEDEQKQQCAEVTKKVFASMKYNIGEAKKKGKDEYQVTVTFQPVDLIDKMKALLDEEIKLASEKVEKGEAYRGTEEESLAQINGEIALKFPQLLETAYQSMSYQDEQTIVFTVKKGESGLYAMNGAQISEFVTKIMGLNVNQD